MIPAILELLGSEEAVAGLKSLGDALKSTSGKWRQFQAIGATAGGGGGAPGGSQGNPVSALVNQLHLQDPLDAIANAIKSSFDSALDMVGKDLGNFSFVIDIAKKEVELFVEAMRVAAQRQTEIAQGAYSTGGSEAESETLNRISREAGQSGGDLASKAVGINEKLLQGNSFEATIARRYVQSAMPWDADKSAPLIELVRALTEKMSKSDAQLVAQKFGLTPYLALRPDMGGRYSDSDRRELFDGSGDGKDGNENLEQRLNRAKRQVGDDLLEGPKKALQRLEKAFIVACETFERGKKFLSNTPLGRIVSGVGKAFNWVDEKISGLLGFGPDKTKGVPGASVAGKNAEHAKELLTTQQRLINSIDRNTEAWTSKTGTFGGGARLARAIPEGLMWGAQMDSHLRDNYNLGAFPL